MVHNTPTAAENDDVSSLLPIPDCGIVSSHSEKVALILASYKFARNVIIQGLISQLLQHAPGLWVCSKDLFNSQTLPSSISISKFGMEVWKSCGDDIVCQDGTEVHMGSNNNNNSSSSNNDVDGVVLLRHKFDNGYYYYRACHIPTDLQEKHEASLHSHVSGIVQDLYNNTHCSNDGIDGDDNHVVLESNLGSLTDEMKRLLPQALANVMAAKELRVGIVPRTYTISWKEQLVTIIRC